MTTVLVVMGETASGKTARAIALARAFNAEIVSADSRQIYAGMEIGTAAPTPAERAAVPHHLVAFLDPTVRYSAAEFVRAAAAHIRAIHARGKRVIIVGGTGFYIRALCGEMALGPPADPQLRARLTHEAAVHEQTFLYSWLQTLDPARGAVIQAGDKYRTLRALEIALSRRLLQPPKLVHSESPTEIDRPESPTEIDRPEFPSEIDHSALPTFPVLGLQWHKIWFVLNADEHAQRIAQRTHGMLAAGLVAEAERIGAAAVAADAVGYPTVLAYAAGQATLAECEAQLARATRQYAKRQRTWLRREPDVTTFPATARTAEIQAFVAAQCGWPIGENQARNGF